jgi:hypothetical protein
VSRKDGKVNKIEEKQLLNRVARIILKSSYGLNCTDSSLDLEDNDNPKARNAYRCAELVYLEIKGVK